jgi:hypothetical protein
VIPGAAQGVLVPSSPPLGLSRRLCRGGGASSCQTPLAAPKRLGRKLGYKTFAIWQQTSAGHSALSEGKRKVTPAMAAGQTDRVWGAGDLLALLR